MSWQKSDEGEDDRCIFGVSAMQGWRINMEDAHANVLDLQARASDDSNSKDPEQKPADSDVRISYFGVYDGHGGGKGGVEQSLGDGRTGWRNPALPSM